MEKVFTQNDWSGGLADTDSYGGEGTYAEAVGIDIHSEPRLFRASQALKKASGTLVTDFPLYSLHCSTGTTYFFGSSGTVYSRDATGSYGTVYQTSGGTICGCGEQNGYIYWASSGTLLRISTGSSWATDVNANFGTLSSSPYHQMVKNGLYLFIINDELVASVDDSAGTLTVAGKPDVTLQSLPDDFRYTAISNFGNDLILGTKNISGTEECRIARWDTVSTNFNSTDEIPESSINTFLTIDNYTLAQAGGMGRLYYYNGDTLEPFRKIKGDYDNKSMICHPDSKCQFRGLGMLGISNLYGNPLNEGVYSIGQYDKNYPMAINLDYVISHGSVKNIEIGTMCSAGTLLMVAWKAGTTYGIDEIDWTNKYASAYVKTIAVSGSRYKQKQFGEYNISYKTKPSGTDIGLEYDINYGSSEGTITLDNNQTGYYKMSGDASLEAGVAQFKIKLTTSGNSSPEVEELYTSFNERDVV